MKFGKIWNITQWLSVDDQRNVLLKQLVLICRSIESVSGLMQRERDDDKRFESFIGIHIYYKHNTK